MLRGIGCVLAARLSCLYSCGGIPQVTVWLPGVHHCNTILSLETAAIDQLLRLEPWTMHRAVHAPQMQQPQPQLRSAR